MQSPRHEDLNDDVLADAFVACTTWLASATMHTIPSAVDKASVRSGKVEENYIRTLRKVTDEAAVVLLVLDPHDWGRGLGCGKLVEEQARGGGQAARVRVQQDWDKLWTSVLLCNMVKPEDLDDPTSDDTFFALPISAPLYRFSTSYRGVLSIISPYSAQRLGPVFVKTLALISFNAEGYSIGVLILASHYTYQTGLYNESDWELTLSFHPTWSNDLDWFLMTSDGRHMLHEGRPVRSMHLYPAPDIRAKSARLLSSLGVLLARSLRPHTWRHVPALKALVRNLHSDSVAQGDNSQDIWDPARQFFELRKACFEDLGSTGT
ncbi:hypothetical protein EDB87DRAFT_1725883 [Lactarius vividus]|nr:hypothetical protein EDB87DRAFT_1725883 [Lactarius vividus]